MPVIDLTGRSLHYLYSSWLSVTPYALQTLLNQFSNFVGCLSCNCGTDEQTLSTPEHVQLIKQGCPLTLGIKPCSGHLLDQSRSFGWMEFTQPLGVGLGLVVKIINQYSTQYVWEDAQMLMQQSMIHRKYHGKSGYLLGNVDIGIQEFRNSLERDTVWMTCR